LNHARFQMYRKCGFVPKPDFMKITPGEFNQYNPLKRVRLEGVEPLIINIQVIGARHLPKAGRGTTNPIVEVEILGCEFDRAKMKTQKADDNGLNPVWTEDNSFDFDVLCPENAFLRFAVYDQDQIFGEANFLVQHTIPLVCVKQGVRAVPLKNAYSEPIPLCSLLVFIDIRTAKDEDESIYDTIENLRERCTELRGKISGGVGEPEKLKGELDHAQKALLKQKEERKKRNMERFKQNRSK